MRVEVILCFLTYEKNTKVEIDFCHDFSFSFRLIGSLAHGMTPLIFRVGLSLSVDVLHSDPHSLQLAPMIETTAFCFTEPESQRGRSSFFKAAKVLQLSYEIKSVVSFPVHPNHLCSVIMETKTRKI